MGGSFLVVLQHGKNSVLSVCLYSFWSLRKCPFIPPLRHFLGERVVHFFAQYSPQGFRFRFGEENSFSFFSISFSVSLFVSLFQFKIFTLTNSHYLIHKTLKPHYPNSLASVPTPSKYPGNCRKLLFLSPHIFQCNHR